MKWRLVLINPNIPKASFYTIQYEDYNVMDYKEYLQTELAQMRYHDEMIRGKGGDLFGQWQEDYELPEFLINP